MSRPNRLPKLQNFSVATEESKRVIAAFKVNADNTTQSVAAYNRASSAASRDLANSIKKVMQ